MITYVNHTTPGFTREQMVGASMYDFMAPLIRARKRRLVQDILQNSQPVTDDSYFHDPKLGTQWFRMALGPIRRGEGIVGLILVATDVSEEHRLTEVVAQTEQELAHARELPDSEN